MHHCPKSEAAMLTPPPSQLSAPLPPSNHGPPFAVNTPPLPPLSMSPPPTLQDESAKQWGAELRVIGDLSRAPPALQAAAARLMQSSKESGPTRAVVNICFSYTSSQELQHAADEICGGLAESHLLTHDVRPSLLQRVMHTKVGAHVNVGQGRAGAEQGAHCSRVGFKVV